MEAFALHTEVMMYLVPKRGELLGDPADLHTPPSAFPILLFLLSSLLLGV